ncbi:MAG: acyl-CoA dehydrogenase family protein [Pseudomonadales bacterium]|nr:acyl-CoA dehydrogenase family protein [Pseudomonadales bacterium]
MHSQLTPRLRDFVRDVAAFLEANLDPALRDKVKHGARISREELTAWTRVLDARGWAAPHWPTEHGGTGWNLVQRQLFDNTCREAHAPQLLGFNFNMVGPAIIRFGTPAQQARFLPPTRTGALWWCQGYSEPQAGSDLATLATRAERDGDHYLVNGQKIWTTGAEDADWIFCLVRTDPAAKPQRGISFLLIDLHSPGVEVRPLYAFNGKRLWNQVFFSDVRVPIDQRIGAENQGWTVAKRLLGDERLLVSRVAENRRTLALLEELLAAKLPGGDLLAVDPQFRTRVSALHIRLRALEASSLRLLTAADGGTEIGAEPSMLKYLGSTLVQATDELLVELTGYHALIRDAGGNAFPGLPQFEYLASGLFHHRGYTIAGGASEVQHNILAREVLGL